MNREYNSRVLSKNSERLLKNLKNTTGDYFFLPHPVQYQYFVCAAEPSVWWLHITLLAREVTHLCPE